VILFLIHSIFTPQSRALFIEESRRDKQGTNKVTNKDSKKSTKIIKIQKELRIYLIATSMYSIGFALNF
jgi:hypothetical protein